MVENFNSTFFQDYYKSYRNKFDDLFPSEKHFFDEFVSDGENFLDVGCAQAGMKDVINERLNCDFSYTGIDISERLIGTAKEMHPECDFFVGTSHAFDPKSKNFDRVVSFGTTVHDLDFYNTIRRCYDLCSGKLFFDVRLSFDLPTQADVSSGFTKDESGPPYPYVVANYIEFLTFVNSITAQSSSTSIFGYYGNSNANTTLPTGYENIIMACVLIDKNANTPVGKKISLITS
jgi:SAM-dependent methyltransferase